MRIYKKNNVKEESLLRIERLFNEFEHVIVSSSGGKDSTVILNLALEVATKLNRLPLDVIFVDQEGEWTEVVNYQRRVVADPRIKFHWYQIPIKLFNSTSNIQDWLYCWEEGKEWLRDKEPNAIGKNIYGTERFKDVFDKILIKDFGPSVANIGGIRADESFVRMLTTGNHCFYKDITWGKKISEKEEVYTFYPIYDWGLSDVWHYIENEQIDYCRTYDYFYKHGVAANNMRVSNLHHETAVHNLYYLQEMDPPLWNALTKRLRGISTISKIEKKDNFSVRKLPYMFDTWRDYTEHLLENLVSDKKVKEKMRKRFDKSRDRFVLADANLKTKLEREYIKCILANDYFFTKLHNMEIKVHQKKSM